MYPRLRNAVLVATLIAAALTSWYWRRPTADVSQETKPFVGSLGYYLTDAVLLGTGDDGRILYEVTAARAQEAPDQGRLLLSEVRVEYRPAAAIPWQVKADNGEAPTDGSHLLLSGDVELASNPEADGSRTVIHASTLTLDAEDFVARSEQAVSVFVGSDRLDAVGMSAHLKDDRLELESEVHGQFPP